MADSTLPPQGDVVTFLRKRDYIMIRELGSGACGRTVLLHDDLIDQQFVCKKYTPYSEARRQELFANFLREIKLLHQVSHPNVVRVFNHYLYPDQFTGYILMEFVDGTDVEDHCAQAPEKTNDLFLQAVNGFTYLENANILHRDIRPQNLMVGEDGTLKIIDLGFGKRVSEPVDFEKSISLNWWCETPQEFGHAHYDYATEVYFVGKLFERLISGNNVAQFKYTDILRRMCDRDPDRRIQRFSMVLQEIGSNRFSEVGFNSLEIRAYREFANALFASITRMDHGTKYIDDPRKIGLTLDTAYRSFMLEEMVPDAALVTRCLINGTYRYWKQKFPVAAVKDFLALLKSCTEEQGRIILANLHTKLDTIERRSETTSDEIPF